MNSAGKLAENVMHFARVLRRAGLPVGPDRVIDALRALEIAGLARRDDFYWTLAAVFLDRREQRELFDQAFHVFWRDPDLLSRVMQLLLPQAEGRGVPRRDESLAPRLADALAPLAPPRRGAPAGERIEVDATLTFSAREVLQHKDFEKMTARELAEAEAAIAQLRTWLQPVPTRRLKPDARGRRIDLRASLRAGLRGTGALIPLKRRAPAERRPPLIVLCDVSGSMHRYSRMLLHFVHAVIDDSSRVHAFAFGTRLTNVTRQLRHRDADAALEDVSRAVPDWAGGTRIGACLREFNLRWSRRVLGQNATVLLISDGLDRDDAKGLAVEMQRLHNSCRELIWLNPLLRYPGFEARPAGIRTMLPHVDRFLPVHNLESLAELAAALAHAPSRSGQARAA